MQITIRPATAEDVASCAATAAAAFSDNLLIQRVTPGPEEATLAFWAAVAASGIEGGGGGDADAEAHVVVAEDASARPPRALLGFAKWVHVPAGAPPPPIVSPAAPLLSGRFPREDQGGSTSTSGQRETQMQQQQQQQRVEELISAVADPELAGSYLAGQSERHERIMARREHWYLALICAAPGAEGRGVGSGLVRWGADRADADGCAAYLEASPEGRPLFEKFGWRVVERLELLGGAYVECSMVRDAVPAEGKMGE